MPFFLFIPGGKRTASDFDAVRAILTARGHGTEAITLSDPERASLSGHIAEVGRALEVIAEPRVVLVGHSYGGLVITPARPAPRPSAWPGWYPWTRPSRRTANRCWTSSAWPGWTTRSSGCRSGRPSRRSSSSRQPSSARYPSYVHCTRSQFLEMTRQFPAYVKSHALNDHWDYLEIDAEHNLMLDRPQELAGILSQG